MTSAGSVSPTATCPDFSFEAFVHDLETVVDQCGLDRFALLGISQGVPVSIAYAVRHPKRVSRLVLCGGFAKGWHRRGNAADVARAEASVTLIREGWGQDNPAARQMFTSLIVPDATHEEMQWFNELERISASADTAIRLLRVIGDIDITESVAAGRDAHAGAAQSRRREGPIRARPVTGPGDPDGALRGAGEQESPDPVARGGVAAFHR